MTNIFKRTIHKALIILLVLGSLTAFVRSVSASGSNIIFFWGEGCPHCEVVKNEISKNGYDKKVTIDYKEIYSNVGNARLFDEKIKECGISPYNAGVPMVYIRGSCWMGQDEAIYAIKKEIEKSKNSVEPVDEKETPTHTTEPNINEEIRDKGKRSTEIMLLSIFIVLTALVGVGYSIQNRKSKVMNIALVLTLISVFSLFSAQPAHAVCPLCTVAVGAGLGLSRYLGIDDVITGLWIGGLIVSTIYWIIDWLSKRDKNGLVVNILTTVITYAFVLVPLYWGGIIGHPFNTFLGIDKILFGTSVGSLAFFLGAQLHFYLKKQSNDKVIIPFQKVVVPVGTLWLISLILYLIIY